LAMDAAEEDVSMNEPTRPHGWHGFPAEYARGF
jgi:hypothetical protein